MELLEEAFIRQSANTNQMKKRNNQQFGHDPNEGPRPFRYSHLRCVDNMCEVTAGKNWHWVWIPLRRRILESESIFFKVLYRHQWEKEAMLKQQPHQSLFLTNYQLSVPIQ